MGVTEAEDKETDRFGDGGTGGDGTRGMGDGVTNMQSTLSCILQDASRTFE